jgi:hypothetical protein
MVRLLNIVLILYSSSLFAQNWNTFNTNSGYIKLGPANSSWAHIYTDRSKFIFNKDVYSYKGGFSSYSWYDLKLKTNGSTRMTIKKSNGNVGIGTTNPVEKLEVNGNGKFKGLHLPSNSKLRFGMENPNSWMTIQNASCCYSSSFDFKGNLYFRNTNEGVGQAEDHPIGIQRDGTVTMGVWETYDNSVRDTQGHRLMVNGGILCERVKVIEDVPNSDYVFEKDYDLLPLSEVKQFILENKHLPEVPSAAEFKENGYNLGEMDDILLRKIEELTLHMIRLEEELKELKK